MRRSRGRAALAAGTVVLLGVGLLPAVSVAGAVAAPTVDDAFTLNAADLRFILRQIKIAERHAATATADNPCGTMIGTHPDQIPAGPNAHELPWGLRTVTGIYNNILPGKQFNGAADRPFPRLTGDHGWPGKGIGSGSFDVDGPGPAPAQNVTSTGYGSTDVIDRDPRVISNLIVDQTMANPAAVAAAASVPGSTPRPDGSIFIPNRSTDEGLSAPYNSWFTLFGQFFDHGLDLARHDLPPVLRIGKQRDIATRRLPERRPATYAEPGKLLCHGLERQLVQELGVERPEILDIEAAGRRGGCFCGG